MKKLKITYKSADSLATTALSARLFSGIVIDSPDLGNCAWISILLGTLLTFPIAWTVSNIHRSKLSSMAIPCIFRKSMFAVFGLLFAFNAAVTSTFIVSAASYAALDTITTFYLLIPLFAMSIWSLSFNGDSIGSSAHIWSRLLTAIIILISLILIPDYRPAWLTPVFGNGILPAINGAIRIAGWQSLACVVYLIAEQGSAQDDAPHPVRTLISGTVYAVILSLLFGMLTPMLEIPEASTRFARLDVLLANGRLTLALQLPFLILLFIGLFFLLLYDCFVSAAMIQKCFSAFSKMTSIAVSTAAVLAISLCGFTKRNYSLSAAPFIYLITAVATAVYGILIFTNKRGEKNASAPSASD